MKKIASVFLASTLLLGLQVGCTLQESDSSMSTLVENTQEKVETSFALQPSANPITIRVMTSFGGSDGNRQNYEKAYQAFEKATGHTVIDSSVASSESWKQEVLTGFQTGAEPDVLYFYTGVDADPLVLGDKVVSLEEIRTLYPDYGRNMKEEMLPVSTFDGNCYALPVNGYWEGLFVNKVVLEEVGIDIPDSGYHWGLFLEDCEKIKEAGYTPISASLLEKPELWFEFLLLNNGSLDNHLKLPSDTTDSLGLSWRLALDDFRTLYMNGYFPENTFEMTQEESNTYLVDGLAAFQIAGTSNLNWYHENAVVEDFTVTYFPGKGQRNATEILGGISMGYYITRGAWEDTERREAAVDFVSSMTGYSVVRQFGATSLTALDSPMSTPSGVSLLEQSAISMKEGATGVVDYSLNGLEPDVRSAFLSGFESMLLEGLSSQEYMQMTLGIP